MPRSRSRPRPAGRSPPAPRAPEQMSVDSLTSPPPAAGRAQTLETEPRRARPRVRIVHWAFAGPAAALFVVFFAYPLGASLYQSFTADREGVTTWVGLQQY